MSTDTALVPEVVSTAAPTRRLRRPSHDSLVLGVILTSQLMVVLDATIVNVALPQMQQALGFSGASHPVRPVALTLPRALGLVKRKLAAPLAACPPLPKRQPCQQMLPPAGGGLLQSLSRPSALPLLPGEGKRNGMD